MASQGYTALVTPPLLRAAFLLLLSGVCASLSAADSSAAPAPPSPILASYDFEQDPPSGPDTFRLFEQPRGRVDLSEAFRVSGLRSLRLREGKGDGSFSEFQGYFPERTQGPLLVQFYILFADPKETFNFGLAGPRWFQNTVKDGHAVWLATRNGKLAHRPAGGWRELFAPRPFTWYLVDLLYDIDRGTYHLAIYEEGLKEPQIDLRDQRNFARADSSSVAYYSFIGDLEDRDAATFFVDDVLIATDPAVRLAPFVAPGRRRFFVERLGWPPAGEHERDDLLAEALTYLRRGDREKSPLAPEHADRLERAAGEAFYANDLDLAEALFEALRDQDDRSAPQRTDRILLKLADLYHLRGWVDEERAARERIYGRLQLGE